MSNANVTLPHPAYLPSESIVLFLIKTSATFLIRLPAATFPLPACHPPLSIGRCGLFVRLPLLVWDAVDDDNLHVKSIRSMLSSFLPTEAKAAKSCHSDGHSPFLHLGCFFSDCPPPHPLPYFHSCLPFALSVDYSPHSSCQFHCIFYSFFVSKFPAGSFF